MHTKQIYRYSNVYKDWPIFLELIVIFMRFLSFSQVSNGTEKAQEIQTIFTTQQGRNVDINTVLMVLMKSHSHADFETPQDRVFANIRAEEKCCTKLFQPYTNRTTMLKCMFYVCK